MSDIPSTIGRALTPLEVSSRRFEDALWAFRTTSGLTMKDPAPAPAPAPAAGTTPAPAAPPAGEPAPPADPEPTPAADPAPAAPPAAKPNPWDDPAAAEAEIKKLRQENAAARTNAKAQAAEDARKDLAQTIGKALGLVEDEPIDPAALTEQLTKSQDDAKRARVELAVFRAAPGGGGDPAALLDSTSFLATLDGIDPADAPAITEAIKTAVAANPRLGVATDPRVPAPNPAQGAAGAQVGLEQQIAEASKAGNHALAISLKRQQAQAQATNR